MPPRGKGSSLILTGVHGCNNFTSGSVPRVILSNLRSGGLRGCLALSRRGSRLRGQGGRVRTRRQTVDIPFIRRLKRNYGTILRSNAGHCHVACGPAEHASIKGSRVRGLGGRRPSVCRRCAGAARDHAFQVGGRTTW